MKRLGLLSIIGCSVSGVAIAAGVDCNVIPSCAEMGFDKTVAECGESKVLRCPFDLINDDAVFCAEGNTKCDALFTLDSCPSNGICAECDAKFILHSCESGYTQGGTTSCCSDEYYNLTAKPDNATVEQCGSKYHFTGCEEGSEEKDGSCIVKTGVGCTSVGSILYNDLNCYTTAPSGKTAIGVVFDVTNKLAIGLTQTSSTMPWWGSAEDVPGLDNCDGNTVRTSCATSGKANSAALVAATYTYAGYAAGYCYNQTTGGLAKGGWFLPSMKELKTISDNKSTIDSAITSAGGTAITSNGHWSSNEENSSWAWYLQIGWDMGGSPGKSNNYKHVRCAVAY